MTENEIMMGFYSFLISNAIFQVGGLFLLWVGFRATLRIYDEGAPMLNKVLVTLFALGIVFINLQTIGFLDITWQSVVNELAELDNLSSSGQSFVEFLGTGETTFNLIPNNPVFAVFWLVVTIMLLAPIWVKKQS